ncbi:MAG: indolepyruvate ferredoxin oxidoreductase subunit alpha [bacterium]
MGIFKKNRNILPSDQDYEFISGVEFILKRALNNGINNVFLDDKLTERLPEIPKTSFLKIQSDMDFLWTSVYSLSITNRSVLGFSYDQSFLNFIYLEKYFMGNKNLNGGIVLFLFKKPGIKKFSFSFESIFPVYNYYKISDFLDYLPYYFEISEKLKLPVLIYLNDSVMNEYNPDEKKEYTERTAAKPHFSFENNNEPTIPFDIKNNIQFLKNTGKHIELFKGLVSNNLVLTDAKYFHRIIENREFSENSDIILFNLLNPIDSEEFIKLIKEDCGNLYKNIYIFDDNALLRQQLADILENNKSLLSYENLKLNNAENGSGIKFGFCSDDFKTTEIKTLSSFCMGCNLFTFLQSIERKMAPPENYILIGAEGCFPLLNSSALKFSFQNIMITENPLFFSFNLNPKYLNKSFYIFIPSLKFSEQIDKFIRMAGGLNFKDKIVFVIYKSIYDFDYNLDNLISHPLLKSFKKIILKKGVRLKDLNASRDASLVFIDNDCKNSAKSGRNLNYSAYLCINNSICDKFECKLCYQKTKCPAIKIKEDKNIFIDAEVCNVCKLCIDICPHNAIKSKKRKKIKIKKSLESKINL